MTERPSPDDEPELPPDPPPASDPDPSPRYPMKAPRKHDARPETLADNTKVTPLDEGKNLEHGIEVDEK